MTTSELAARFTPTVRTALEASRPRIKNTVGRVGWVALWPAWAVVTGPLLGVLVRLAVELAVGAFAPQLVPILAVIEAVLPYVAESAVPNLSREFVAELSSVMRTRDGDMLPEVLYALGRITAAQLSAQIGDGVRPHGDSVYESEQE